MAVAGALWLAINLFVNGVNVSGCFAQIKEADAATSASPHPDAPPVDSASGYQPIPFPRPVRDGDNQTVAKQNPWRSVVGSLAIVIGLFLAFVLLFRRTADSRSGDALPTDAFEVIGRTSIAPRQQLHLVRLGGRLLLLNQADQKLDTLCEISAPEEVDHLMRLCGYGEASAMTTAVQNVLRKLR